MHEYVHVLSRNLGPRSGVVDRAQFVQTPPRSLREFGVGSQIVFPVCGQDPARQRWQNIHFLDPRHLSVVTNACLLVHRVSKVFDGRP